MTGNLADELREMVDGTRRRVLFGLDRAKKALMAYTRARAAEGKTSIEIYFPIPSYELCFNFFVSWCRGQGFAVDVQSVHPMRQGQEPDYYGFLDFSDEKEELQLCKHTGDKDAAVKRMHLETMLVLYW